MVCVQNNQRVNGQARIYTLSVVPIISNRRVHLYLMSVSVLLTLKIVCVHIIYIHLNIYGGVLGSHVEWFRAGGFKYLYNNSDQLI